MFTKKVEQKYFPINKNHYCSTKKFGKISYSKVKISLELQFMNEINY